ncbi:hypothetical protein P389DRAFT_168769 [Cystobasidium minutum MCA 4210]|uniref:uncharacterized protein n=1 Tax=Cystobasidium minutum MCA 4210 TaxID=1397322 RepID=UPI0034CE0C15|eukprot:jgi/Rhomi1/168769/fgenesh1_kg.3_\
MSFSSAYNPPVSTVPPPSAPGVSGVLPGQQAVNTTRVLSLTGFSKDLKTRDIQAIFVDYEDDRGGYRIKWLDDTGCLIVFNDPMVAKRAFLNLTANPHPHLMPVISKNEEETPSTYPKLVPYDGDDIPNIVASVATRPRSRSIAQNNNSNPASTSTERGSAPTSGAHYRRMSSSRHNNNGRASMSQYQMQAIMDDANSAVAPTTPSKSNASSQANGRPESTSPTNKGSPSAGGAGTATASSGGAIDWNALQQQAVAQSTGRARTGSGSSANHQSSLSNAGQAFSPPTSPDRGLGLGQRAGAVSPSTLRRLVSANRG